MKNQEKIKNDLKTMLSEYRYLHSLRVADVAMELARIYSYDQNKAYIAGLVHDIAKEFTLEENKEVILKYHLSSNLLRDDYQKQLHADIGAVLAREKYHLDEEVCHAIFCHTMGDIPMNKLDKILFVADKIEPMKDYDGIDKVRELAYVNLNQAVILCMECQINKIVSKNIKLHPKIIEVLNYLKKEGDMNVKIKK